MKNLIIKAILPAILFAAVISSPLRAHDHEKKTQKDIVTVAVEAGSFKTLAAALTATGLVDALRGKGPFTVFAPNDDAFDALPEGTVESLLNDKETLKKILLYHVVNGNVTSGDVIKIDKAGTLAGQNLKVSVKDGDVFINSSKVISADIKASNGTIHVINKVLIPN